VAADALAHAGWTVRCPSGVKQGSVTGHGSSRGHVVRPYRVLMLDNGLQWHVHVRTVVRMRESGAIRTSEAADRCVTAQLDCFV
jgi:hypothetical protein